MAEYYDFIMLAFWSVLLTLTLLKIGLVDNPKIQILVASMFIAGHSLTLLEIIVVGDALKLIAFCIVIYRIYLQIRWKYQIKG